MTVRELIASLLKLPQDSIVRIPDTFWQNEGYGPHYNDFELLWPRVTDVQDCNGYVVLNADDEDWD